MKFSFFALAFVLTLSAAQSFAQSKETRDLDYFSKIAIGGGYDAVILQEGAKESISIEAEGVDLHKIETKVVDGTLKVGMKKGDYNNVKIKMTITYRNLSSVSSAGSSDIIARSVIKGDAFSLNSSGSGNFKGEFDVKDLNVAISGSSDMTLQGKADAQSIQVSGSGDIDASGLSGETASVAISGSGDVQLNVKGKVKTMVSGSGDVTNKRR